MYGKERLLLSSLLLFGARQRSIAAFGHSLGVLHRSAARSRAPAAAIFPLAFGIIRDEFPRERVASGDRD